MKIEELRIGSWVTTDDIYFKVETLQSKNHWENNDNSYDIDIDLIDINGNGSYCELKYLKGIPITEEWLLKFGFVQASEFKQHYLLECEFGVYEYAFFDSIKSLWINETFIPNIQYIHQLQNLYFALTQTELEIK